MSDHHPGGLQPPPSSSNVAAGQSARLQQVLTGTGTQNINVINTRGQQFVITSQMGVSGQGMPQAGMTRILNIAPSPHVNVAGMSQAPARSNGTAESTLDTMSLVSIHQPTLVNASSHPTLVSSLSTPPRTRNMSGMMDTVHSSTVPPGVSTSTPILARPPGIGNSTPKRTQSPSYQATQPRKRIKLSDLQDSSLTLVGGSAADALLDIKLAQMRGKCEHYAEMAAELFFLQADGNMMDYHTWRKRAPTAPFLHFLRTHPLDPNDDDEDLTLLLSVNVGFSQATTPHPEIKVEGGRATPVAVSTTLPPAVAQLNQQGHIPGRPQGGRHGMVFGIKPTSTGSVGTTVPLVPGGTPLVPESISSIIGASRTLGLSPTTPNINPKLKTLTPASNQPRQHPKQHSTPGSYNETVGSQEQIAEKAKHEASIMQRVGDLQREGIWGEKRLPKLHELPRAKAHWDYLVEEMVWLAADFAQERKWKKAAAKKCARNVQKYFQERTAQAKKEEKSQELQLKKTAGFIAKEIKTFWSNAEKIVEHKQRTRLEVKRKQALDQHLSFIVDQTERYSTWLAESMNKSGIEGVGPSVPTSHASSLISSPSRPDGVDDEFEPNLSSTDDEETIAKAEEDMGITDNKDEIEMLKRESELPIEDLLRRLQAPDPDTDLSKEDDAEFKASEKEESDDEDTIMEQENAEGKVDHKKEIADLQAENLMSIDDLMAKYGGTGPMEYADDDMDSDDEKGDSEEDEDLESDESEEMSETEEEDEEEMGLKSLMDSSSTSKVSDNEAAGKEINDVAALAESIQPKGNTLSSTNVVTPIPFLLKHTLREYQHIGLDWLVTMFDRKLNGILADEMGLGKTIQTISLLAHLACEKGNWGPHLIIVPTSVMLNWEMELKKWCPAFKILTYYGTQKERKLKRTGWTKPNAFHICITSYKLVIQDHQSFRRKKWKYLILDEAQNIKNFKSQRWQLLLNFQTQRRLLLTGTPLQNNLMELWSLMHFLMPNVFQSHREFKEWFSNPVSGMIEGNSEYNETIIKRLHKVLRPFLLRRLKCEVEKQLPKKYEHVVMCRLSKRQRYLYDDFMSRAKTRETLATGNLLSVINVLMQLRKVCNHPNLFEVRPTLSPFQMEGLAYPTASVVWSPLDYNYRKNVSLSFLNFLLLELESNEMTAYAAHYARENQTPRKLIEEIDRAAEPAPPCPTGRLKFHVRDHSTNAVLEGLNIPTSRHSRAPQRNAGAVTLQVTGGTQLQGVSVQLVQHKGSLKAIPVATLGSTPQPVPVSSNQAPQPSVTSFSVKQGDGVQTISVPAGFAHLVQTSTGRRILLTTSPSVMQPLTGQNQAMPATTTSYTMAGGQRLAVLSKPSNSPAGARFASPSAATSPSRVSMRGQLPASLINALIAGSPPVTPTSSPNKPQPLLAALGARNNSATKNSEPRRKQGSDDATLSRFYHPKLEELRRRSRREKLTAIHSVNDIRCQSYPLYGADTRHTLNIMNACWPSGADSWCSGAGFVHCLNATRPLTNYWLRTRTLDDIVRSPQRLVDVLKEVFARFVLCVPAVSAPHPHFHVSHPPPSRYWELKRSQAMLQQELSSRCALLHPIASAMITQFPDPRLIQYDCGKLQVLDRLLRQLKTGHHRVLIFTQMTRMLDVLEAFLNFHGLIYLRLDGTTKVDQRQLLMERFNADRRIFCFILSTRSGGIGVNLTGADTVIFYDSDWNPTMDAQAQDRCHRIGQTRDVHIYRLVSEMTVEENILKKANQKRLLGDLAIEGGNFTTAYFKSSTIQDLFNIDKSENDASRRMAEVLEGAERRKAQADEERSALGALETALAAAEDDSDVLAARTAKAEAAADLAEFDENIPLEDPETAAGEPEISKAEQEVNNLVQMLTPVERYAMRFIEETESLWSAEQLAAAEAEIENQKREWEVGRRKALKEEEERQLQLAVDDDLLTYSREDAENQVWVSTNAMEQMPMWCPPTPPRDENDVYIDYSMGFLYEQPTMSESQLPPVYVKRERKRTRMEAMPILERDGRRPNKIRHKEESFYAPRSLFDRPSTAVLKMRRDMKLQKCRGIIRPPMSIPGLKPPLPVKPFAEPENVPEWIINEDWIILQTVQNTLGLPLNLMVISPGHTPNWDLVSEMVNNSSVIYRSPKQCKNRYEAIIVPREEGKVLYDANPKKLKKNKGVYKVQQQTKTNRPMRTSQLNLQDNNLTRTRMFSHRFEVTKAVLSKRTPTVKPLLVNPTLNNPKHAAVLAECGVEYDTASHPPKVAFIRAERIAKEKQKTALQAQAQAQVLSAEQQLAAQRLQQQQAAAAKTATTPTPAATTAAVLQTSTGVVVSISPMQMTQQPSTPQPSVQQLAAVVTTTTAAPAVATVTPTVARARPVTTLTVQEMVAAANQVRAANAAGTPTMVSVGNLLPAQMQVAQRLASANLVAQPQTAVTVVSTKGVTGGTVTAGGKTLTATQVQYYRQQQLLRQQQQRQLREQQIKALQTASGQKVSVAVTTANALGVTTVQVTPSQGSSVQPQQRTQFIKQTTAGGKQITRPVTEAEMAVLLKRQQQINAQQKAQAGLAQAQILTQAGLQVQTAAGQATPQLGTLVKAVASPAQSLTIPMTLPQVRTALPLGIKSATPQQIRQMQLHQQMLQQRKLAGQKVAHVTQVPGKGAQLLVQSQKPTAVMFQQLNQVMKQVAPQHVTHVPITQTAGGQIISHAVLARTPTQGGQTLQARVIPVSTVQQQQMKQTIQVVSAQTATRAAVPNVTIDSAGRPQVTVASTLASALAGTIKVGPTVTTAQHQAMMSQVNAALQGQPLSVRANTVRGGPPLIAVTIQQQAQGAPTVVTAQQLVPQSSNAPQDPTTRPS